MSVPLVRLGDVAEFIRGITFKPDDVIPVDAPDAVVCMRTKNVQASLDDSDLIAIPAKFVKRQEQFIRESDILVSSANSWNLIGKCCWVPTLAYRAAAGGFISILRARGERLDSRYLYHWFANDRTQATLRSFGNQTTNISNLNISRTLDLQLPWPPLAEQKRIAAILDASAALREKRSLSIKFADSLTRATFLEMFGDAAGIPERLLIEVCSPKQWPTITEDQLTDEGYPVYGANGRIGFYSQYNHEHPTVLITCRGATCGTINVCESKSYVTGNAMALDNPTGVSTAYLEWVLRLRGLKDTITGSAQPQITRAGLANVRIPVPPIERQLEFEGRLETIRARTKDLEQALELTRTLQAGLQSRLFAEVGG